MLETMMSRMHYCHPKTNGRSPVLTSTKAQITASETVLAQDFMGLASRSPKCLQPRNSRVGSLSGAMEVIPVETPVLQRTCPLRHTGSPLLHRGSPHAQYPLSHVEIPPQHLGCRLHQSEVPLYRQLSFRSHRSLRCSGVKILA